MKLRQLLKIRVLGDDDKFVSFRVIPYLPVARSLQADQPDVRRVGIELHQRLEQTMGKVLIQEQFQATMEIV